MKAYRFPPERKSFKHQTILPRFGDAFRGVVHAYREEPNFRFHAFAASLVLVAGVAVHPEAWETAYLTATVALVLVAELVNTAVERAVDLSTGDDYHPLAAQAKEVAAGAVLVAALHAVFAAWLVFIGRRSVLETWNSVLHMLRQYPWMAAVPLLAAILGLTAGKPPGAKK